MASLLIRKQINEESSAELDSDGRYGGVDFLNPEKFEAKNLKGLSRTPPLLIVELSD